MRKLVIIGIAFLLFASIAYAGVLSYYGKIEGTANVQGPIFYADLTANGKIVGKLLLNTKPSATYTTTFEDGAGVLFRSDDLGGIDFNYNPKCEFSIKVSSTKDSRINLICEYYDKNGTTHTICQTSVNTSTTTETKTASCSGTSTLSSVKYIVYEIKGDIGFDGSYTVETNPEGDTKLQLNKVS